MCWIGTAPKRKNLWKRGAGLVPAPLEEKYYPQSELLKPAYTGYPHLRVRADQAGGVLDKLPVFGPIFHEGKGLEFHRRLREGFLALAHADPERCVVLDGAASADDVADRVWRAVQERLLERGEAL